MPRLYCWDRFFSSSSLLASRKKLGIYGKPLQLLIVVCQQVARRKRGWMSRLGWIGKLVTTRDQVDLCTIPNEGETHDTSQKDLRPKR